MWVTKENAVNEVIAVLEQDRDYKRKIKERQKDQRLRALERKVDALLYAPGGPEYEKAKKHFDQHADTL